MLCWVRNASSPYRFSTQEYWEREYARCVGRGVAALSVLPVAHPSGVRAIQAPREV